MNFLSGGEFPIALPGTGGGTTVSFEDFGIKAQMTVLDKRVRSGHRVLKYNLEITARDSNNVAKVDETVIPVVSGKVMRGYSEIPLTRELLIGPMDTIKKLSKVGVTQKVSTYLWVRIE